MSQFLSLLRISAILARYGLDDLLHAIHLYRPMGWLTRLVPGARANAERPCVGRKQEVPGSYNRKK